MEHSEASERDGFSSTSPPAASGDNYWFSGGLSGKEAFQGG